MLVLADIPMTSSPRSLAIFQTIASLDLRLSTLNEQLDEFETMLSSYSPPRFTQYEDDLFEDGIVEEYQIDDRFLTIAEAEQEIDIDSDGDDDAGTIVYTTEYHYDYDSDDDTETLVGNWEDPFATPDSLFPAPLRRQVSGWIMHEDN